MRFACGSEWAYHCRRVRVDERQGRHGIVRTPGPATATGNVHDGKAIVRKRRRSAGHAHPPGPRCPTVTIGAWAIRAAPRKAIGRGADRKRVRSRRRWAPARAARRGREMRGPLLPPTVPGWRSRAERFDMAVLEAYEPIERRWQEGLSGLDVAVDEIPRISAKDPDSVQWPPEVVADGPIALARLIGAGVDVRGSATGARVVLFRKPIERRAKDTIELAELLHEILVAQVATYLDVEPSVIDPMIDDE